MPFFHVSMRKGTSDEHRRAIADSIHQGMLESMGLPEDDFFSVIHELDDANFRYPATFWGIPRTDAMIFIQFWWNARAAVTKQIIFDTIADRLVESPGLRREDIIMNINEPAPENWWIVGREVDPRTGTDRRIKPGG